MTDSAQIWQIVYVGRKQLLPCTALPCSRFNDNGKKQICWAHEIYGPRHLSEKYDKSVSDAPRKQWQELYEDLKWLYGESKEMNESGPSGKTVSCHESDP